jgi:hypothetical protein
LLVQALSVVQLEGERKTFNENLTLGPSLQIQHCRKGGGRVLPYYFNYVSIAVRASRHGDQCASLRTVHICHHCTSRSIC